MDKVAANMEQVEGKIEPADIKGGHTRVGECLRKVDRIELCKQGEGLRKKKA